MNATTWRQSLGSPAGARDFALARAPQIVTFVLALALAAQVALIIVSLGAKSRGAPAPTVNSPAANAASQIDVAQIVNTHLFGAAPSQAASGDAANAPTTSMPLVLAGLLAAADPEEGMAIIGENAASAKVVSVGQEIPGGAKLHSVYNDRAVIERGGVLESVFLPRQTSGALAGPPPPLPAANNDGALLDRMRKLVADQPGVVGQIMRPQAVFAGGSMKGFRVYPGTNRQAFARLGLRPGDLVTAVNGTPLDDANRSNDILNTINSSTDARVTVMRNGKQQDLVLNVAQIAAEAEQLIGTEGMIPMDQAPPLPGEPPGNE
jgi:general secretion pathway protein C